MPEEQRCGSLNGEIRPLPLGLDPQMSSAFLEGASRLQRFMKSLMISSAGWVWSVENKAFTGRFPAGSRVRTQRMGKGVNPKRY